MLPNFYNTYGLTYSQAWAYGFGIEVLFYGSMILLVSIVLHIVSILIKRAVKPKQEVLSVRSEEEEEMELNVDDPSYTEMQAYLKEEKRDPKNSLAICASIIEIISSICSWISLYYIAFAPAVMSGLGVISIWLSIFWVLLCFGVKYISLVFWYSPNFLKKNRSTCFKSLWRKVKITSKLHRVRFSLFLGLALASSIALPIFTEGTCMNCFNEGYGQQMFGLGMSTKMTRYFELGTVCKSGQICHLYATLPEDSATGVIVNVHTGPDVDSLLVKYKKQDEKTYEKNVTAQSYYLNLETRGDRHVHSAFLGGLDVNSKYNFEIYYNGKTQRSGNYQTLPSKSLERNILMASGGDVGTSMRARNMTAALETYPLDVILVGGDLAYDNGMPSCYYSWDEFLRMFESINDYQGRLVPLMVSVGNHDLGFNAYQDGTIDITKNLFYIYFPQSSKIASDGSLLTQVPDLDERITYGHHTVGNMVHITLDSGYMLRYKGEQADFIQKISKQYQDRVKMANFHVPMYPACYDNIYDVNLAEDSAKYWGPIFEENNFAGVFENHKHLYKKSFPLVGGVVQPEGEGVVYFGDGNWGIDPDDCLKNGQKNGNNTGVLEVASDMTHVWLINITQTYLTFFAINQTGDVFDKEYALLVSNYIK